MTDGVGTLKTRDWKTQDHVARVGKRGILKVRKA